MKLFIRIDEELLAKGPKPGNGAPKMPKKAAGAPKAFAPPKQKQAGPKQAQQTAGGNQPNKQNTPKASGPNLTITGGGVKTPGGPRTASNIVYEYFKGTGAPPSGGGWESYQKRDGGVGYRRPLGSGGGKPGPEGNGKDQQGKQPQAGEIDPAQQIPPEPEHVSDPLTHEDGSKVGEESLTQDPSEMESVDNRDDGLEADPWEEERAPYETPPTTKEQADLDRTGALFDKFETAQAKKDQEFGSKLNQTFDKLDQAIARQKTKDSNRKRLGDLGDLRQRNVDRVAERAQGKKEVEDILNELKPAELHEQRAKEIINDLSGRAKTGGVPPLSPKLKEEVEDRNNPFLLTRKKQAPTSPVEDKTKAGTDETLVGEKAPTEAEKTLTAAKTQADPAATVAQAAKVKEKSDKVVEGKRITAKDIEHAKEVHGKIAKLEKDIKVQEKNVAKLGNDRKAAYEKVKKQGKANIGNPEWRDAAKKLKQEELAAKKELAGIKAEHKKLKKDAPDVKLVKLNTPKSDSDHIGVKAHRDKANKQLEVIDGWLENDPYNEDLHQIRNIYAEQANIEHIPSSEDKQAMSRAASYAKQKGFDRHPSDIEADQQAAAAKAAEKQAKAAAKQQANGTTQPAQQTSKPSPSNALYTNSGDRTEVVDDSIIQPGADKTQIVPDDSAIQEPDVPMTPEQKMAQKVENKASKTHDLNNRRGSSLMSKFNSGAAVGSQVSQATRSVEGEGALASGVIGLGTKAPAKLLDSASNRSAQKKKDAEKADKASEREAERLRKEAQKNTEEVNKGMRLYLNLNKAIGQRPNVAVNSTKTKEQKEDAYGNSFDQGGAGAAGGDPTNRPGDGKKINEKDEEDGVAKSFFTLAQTFSDMRKSLGSASNELHPWEEEFSKSVLNGKRTISGRNRSLFTEYACDKLQKSLSDLLHKV